MRRSTRSAAVAALALACGAALSACGTAEEDKVRAVAQEFRRAVAADDGARACRLLTATAKRQLGGECDERVLSIDPGDPASDGALTLRAERASLATRSGGRTRAIAFIKTDDGWRLDDLPLSTAIVAESDRAEFYARCWRAAGAAIATRASHLAFAAAAAPTIAVRDDTVSAKGDNWRIFYTFAGSDTDPGLAEVIADPSVAGAVAYVERAASRADVVARARGCVAG
ncbi:MAG TPA: hypothetical protein VGV90_09580 [Solirubrobacteraceae bacterium]|nr:hypothetical protein [Solirubrobacteraceae bacterium]